MRTPTRDSPSATLHQSVLAIGQFNRSSQRHTVSLDVESWTDEHAHRVNIGQGSVIAMCQNF